MEILACTLENDWSKSGKAHYLYLYYLAINALFESSKSWTFNLNTVLGWNGH